MTEPTLAVVSAGIGKPSTTRLLADRLSEATTLALRDANDAVSAEPAVSAASGGQVTVDVVELREYAHDITNAMLTGFPSGALSGVLERVTESAGLIAVTPVFTASYSGLFKSFFDVLDQEAMEGKPVLLGATGGTERHTLVLEHAMRPMFTYLRAVVAPTSVYAASADWGGANGHDGGAAREASDGTARSTSGGSAEIGHRVARAGAELATLIRNNSGVEKPDPYDEPTPFEQLLHQRQ